MSETPYSKQITPPELPFVPQGPISVDEGAPLEKNLDQFQATVGIKAANVLQSALADVEARIADLANVGDSSIVNNVELLKAELSQLFQEIQFAKYDIEYGFNDHETEVKVPYSITGEPINTLEFLEGVTWILEAAKMGILRSKERMQELQVIIDRSTTDKAELEDEDCNKRPRATLQKTIDTRTETKAKKMKRHKELTREINHFLKIDPKDCEALWEGAETLLAFLCQNGWLPEHSAEKARSIPSLSGEFTIPTNVIPQTKEPREKAQYARIERKKSTNSRNSFLIGMLGLCALIAGAYTVLKPQFESGPTAVSDPRYSKQRPRRDHRNVNQAGANKFGISKFKAMMEVRRLSMQINKLSRTAQSIGENPQVDTKVAKITRLQRRVAELNKQFNLGIEVGNQVHFPAVRIDKILNTVDSDLDIQSFRDILVDNGLKVVHKTLEYRKGTILEDHFIGKGSLFERNFADHAEGVITMSGTIVSTDEQVLNTKLEMAHYGQKTGKVVAISTKAVVEIALSGAINEIVRETITIPGVRFVPDVPYEKTYPIQTPKGPTFLKMSDLKRLNLRPGDYLVGHKTRFREDGSIEITQQP